MDKKLKDRWVKALMSGKYAQGKGALCRDGKYCCLGVLREINDKTDAGKARHFEYLTIKQLNKFKLPLTAQRGLANLNDEEIPFPVIAGFIQENL